MTNCNEDTTMNCSLSCQYDSATLTMVLVVMPIILALGVLGNVTFLFVMVRVPSMRTITNAYLMHLAVADILFLIVAVGDKLTRYLLSPISWDQLLLEDAGCILINLVQHLSNWVSIFLVTLVTLERYYGVCHPLKNLVLHTFSRTWKMIAGAWLVASMLSAVVVPAHYRLARTCIVWPDDEAFSDMPEQAGFCTGVPGLQWLGIYSNGLQIVPFFCAMSFNCFAFAMITYTMKQRFEATDSVLKKDRLRKQVSVMLIANGLTFFVCVAPFEVYCAAAVFRDLTGGTDPYKLLLDIARTMLYLNSAVNPYIYSVTNKTYRQALRKAFTMRARRESIRQGSARTRQEPNNTSHIRLYCNNAI